VARERDVLHWVGAGAAFAGMKRKGRMYRLIATDLDGTLLTPDGTISAATREALTAAQELGVALVIATGRNYPMMRYFCHDLRLSAPQISCNGAVVVAPATGDLLHVSTVPPAFVGPVLRFLEEQGVPAAFFSLLELWISHDNPYAELLIPRELDPPRTVDSLYSLTDTPCAKLVAMDPPEVIERLRPLAEARFGADLYVTQTSRNLLEFHHPQVSKGHALAQIARDLGVSPHEVIAFGDSHNDLEMLRFAGLGVAMGNASDEVKAVADLVTLPNDQDGIARVVSQYILSSRSS